MKSRDMSFEIAVTTSFSRKRLYVYPLDFANGYYVIISTRYAFKSTLLTYLHIPIKETNQKILAFDILRNIRNKYAFVLAA